MRLGYVASSMALLNINMRGYAIMSPLSFRIFGDILSAPALFLGFSLFNSSRTLCSDVGTDRKIPVFYRLDTSENCCPLDQLPVFYQ